MMTWMWISMIVVLVGAQLNAEIEQQTARGPAGRREGIPEEQAIGSRRDSSST
jgi:membrane protein